MNNLLNVAVELMLLGMGTVFVFLTVLIMATKLMSSLVMRFNLDDKEEPVLSGPSPQALANPAQDGRLIKVIEEAIKQHRNQ